MSIADEIALSTNVRYAAHNLMSTLVHTVRKTPERGEAIAGFQQAIGALDRDVEYLKEEQEEERRALTAAAHS